MLRRIGQFFKDITETIKRERGKLQINSDPMAFPVKTGTLSSEGQDVHIKDSHTLQQMFLPMDIKDDIPEVSVKGETDHSHSPGVSSASTAFQVELKKRLGNEWFKPIKDCSCDYNDKLSLKQLEVDTFLETRMGKTYFENVHMIGTRVKETSELGDFHFSMQTKNFTSHKVLVNYGEMKTVTTVNDLETEFDKKQRGSFHFENSTVFNALVEEYTLTPVVKCQHSLACVMRYPIKRERVSKSGYEREELKRALSFIVKRYQSAGPLSIVGIYKNVPIDNAEKLTFTKNRELYFYLKKGNLKRSVLMDVLVVKTKEGKYHVGPIIRKA